MENLIETYKDRLPEPYLEFVTRNIYFEGDLGEELGYVMLWDIGFLNQVFDSICLYHDNIGKDYFPIGSNGGGEHICIKLSSPEKELYYIHSISTSDKEALFYCSSFSNLYYAVKKYQAHGEE